MNLGIILVVKILGIVRGFVDLLIAFTNMPFYIYKTSFTYLLNLENSIAFM